MKKILMMSLLLLNISCVEEKPCHPDYPLTFGDVVMIQEGFYKNRQAMVLRRGFISSCDRAEYVVVIYAELREIETVVSIYNVTKIGQE
jgi:hypothetical protein